LREQKVFDYFVDVEVAPFLDIGRVMSKFSTQLQYNPGVGLRVVAKPQASVGWTSPMAATEPICLSDLTNLLE
jgi:hypothetical protein